MRKTKVDANKPEICFGAFSWNKCATQGLGLPDNKNHIVTNNKIIHTILSSEFYL